MTHFWLTTCGAIEAAVTCEFPKTSSDHSRQQLSAPLMWRLASMPRRMGPISANEPDCGWAQSVRGISQLSGIGANHDDVEADSDPACWRPQPRTTAKKTGVDYSPSKNQGRCISCVGTRTDSIVGPPPGLDRRAWAFRSNAGLSRCAGIGGELGRATMDLGRAGAYRGSRGSSCDGLWTPATDAA